MKKTITASNQSFQYLYSITADASISTIQKLRTAKSILTKLFPTVNAYEMAKAEPVTRVKAIDNQVQLFHNAGQQVKKADEIEALQKRRSEILETEIQPITQTIVQVILEEEEINFVLDEMADTLAKTPKMNTVEEMEMFDILFTALESAK